MFEFSPFFSVLKNFFSRKDLLVIFFIILAFLFGLLTIFITPPLQGPDEDIHFVACWKISHGDFTRSISKPLADFSWVHGYLPWHPEKKYSFEKWQEAMQYRSNTEKNEEILAYGAVTFYAVPSYIPPLAGVALSSIFSDRYLPALYMGRLFCLLTYIALGALALYFLPSGRAVVFLLLMMPQSIFQASVISYDGITNGAMCLWCALLFRDVFSKENEEKCFSRELLLCSILLCFCKVPYMIVLGCLIFLFAIKELRFRNRIWPVLICGFSFPALLIPLKNILEHLPLPENAEKFVRIMEPGQGSVDCLTEQTGPLAERLLQFPQLLFATLTDPSKLLIYAGSLAGCLGALDTLLPPSLLVLYLLLIVFCCFNMENRISCSGRLFFLVCGLGLTGMIFMIFAITYLPSNGTIPGITGRYFIPSAIFLALAAGSDLLKFKWGRKQESFLAVTGALVLGTTMVVTLLQRYYFEYWWDRTI